RIRFAAARDGHRDHARGRRHARSPTRPVHGAGRAARDDAPADRARALRPDRQLPRSAGGMTPDPEVDVTGIDDDREFFEQTARVIRHLIRSLESLQEAVAARAVDSYSDRPAA